MRFLSLVQNLFCEEGNESGKCTIRSDYQAAWNAAVPKFSQLLKEQKVHTFSTSIVMIIIIITIYYYYYHCRCD